MVTGKGKVFIISFFIWICFIYLYVLCVLTFVGNVELLHIPFHFISSVQNSCENIKITDFLQANAVIFCDSSGHTEHKSRTITLTEKSRDAK